MLSVLIRTYAEALAAGQLGVVSQRPWSLRQGDAGDAQVLARLIANGLNESAAVLLDSDGELLNAVGGLRPELDAPGHRTLFAGLAGPGPALSSVVASPTGWQYALGLPVTGTGGSTGTVLVYYRLGASPVGDVLAGLDLGRTGRAHVVDVAGRVIISSGPGPYGRLLDPAVVSVVSAGTRAMVRYGPETASSIATYEPAGVAGWGTVTVQDADEFYEAVEAAGAQYTAVLLLLLALGGMGLVFLNDRRHRALTRLARQAVRDPLTGLANRTVLTDRLRELGAGGEPLAVLFLDLDGFKSVNDTLGHDTGDRLLAAVAGRLAGCVRDGDTLVRLGGDEFVVVLPDVADRGTAAGLAQRMVCEIAEPFSVDGEHLVIGVSIGIALCQADCRDGESLLRGADQAMYRAKKQGRGRYAFAADERVLSGSTGRRVAASTAVPVSPAPLPGEQLPAATVRG